MTEGAKLRLPAEYIDIYERVWDESDYVIPPSENNAFFVMTNVVLTPNQTRTTCPEDPGELPEVICGTRNETTGEVNITQGVCVKGQLTVKRRCLHYSGELNKTKDWALVQNMTFIISDKMLKLG